MSEKSKERRKARRQAKFGNGIFGRRAFGEPWAADCNQFAEAGRATGGVTVIDRFTGEARHGGTELLDAHFGEVRRAREEALASANPCYMVGRAAQNQGVFDAAEIKGMVDAAFECACRESPDAWYPNQYALGLAHSAPEDVAADVGRFLYNFELGLRTSGERAARHLGAGDWLRESRQLAARLNGRDALGGLSDEDLRGIAAHVKAHPRFAEAMAWYERHSGGKMRRHDDDGNAQAKSEAEAHELLVSAGVGILNVSRDEVLTMDLTSSLEKLQGLTADTAKVASAKGRLGLVFAGWENDPRELWEIPEVRRYFAALDEEFPYWLWFLMQGQITLSVLLLCPPDKVESDGRTARSSINSQAIKGWFSSHLDSLADLQERHELPEAEVMAVAREVGEMLESCMAQGGASC